MGWNDHVSYIQKRYWRQYIPYLNYHSTTQIWASTIFLKVNNIFLSGSQKRDVYDFQTEIGIMLDLCSNHNINSLFDMPRNSDYLGQTFKLCILAFSTANSIASNKKKEKKTLVN